jgi:hypothetical protein
MTIEIPCNYFPFQLELTVESKHPIKLRIVADDPNKPSSKYLDRGSKLNGKRKYELKFPVSPKRLNITVLNVENGNLPYGDDPTFDLVDMKVEPIKEYDVWWNQDTKNFYNFAVEFAQNAGILSAGDKKPHVYRSDDGKFTIDYYNTIYDRQSKKMLSTPARIGHNSGIIEVSKAKFMNYTVPMRLVILLHEYAHKYLNPKINRPISYETGADIQALYVYLGKGWSPFEAHKSFLHVFKKANGVENHKRYKVIRDFIDKYDRGKVSTLKK